MNLSLYIAKRYLFAKKSHHAINVISMISVCGVIIATAALVCALSVYNGFGDLLSGLFSHFDPQIKILPTKGKVFDPTKSELTKVKKLPAILYWSEVLEDNALIRYKEKQVIAHIKGVDQQFSTLTQIDSIIIDGQFKLKDEVVDYANLGIGLAASLGVNASFVSPMAIYAPKRDASINIANPSTSFNLQYAYIGGVFCLNQAEYDENYMIVPLSLTRDLFHYSQEVSAIELKLKSNVNESQAIKEIKEILGPNYQILDRYQQQADLFKMMKIEKWITFLILSFILSIALFNVVGSLSMLMIEKQKDVLTLRNLGANERLIKKIFLLEGWLISGSGAFIGIILGLSLCFMQQWFGIIKLGQTAGAFIVDAYPVHVIFSDLFAVFFTVITIGFIAAWYPVQYLSHKWFKNNKLKA